MYSIRQLNYISSISLFKDATKLSDFDYVEYYSEEEMLGYGLSLILLNVGMFFTNPAITITKWYNLRRK